MSITINCQTLLVLSRCFEKNTVRQCDCAHHEICSVDEGQAHLDLELLALLYELSINTLR